MAFFEEIFKTFYYLGKHGRIDESDQPLPLATRPGLRARAAALHAEARDHLAVCYSTDRRRATGYIIY